MKGVWRLIEEFRTTLHYMLFRVGPILLILCNMAGARAQGIGFNGGHKPIDERTSIELFPEYQATFKHQLDIKFELGLTSANPTIGYILRIKNKQRATILNLHYDEENENAILRLNEEGKASIITLVMKKETLHNQRWFPVHIHLDMDQGKASLSANNMESLSSAAGLPKEYNPSIIFGKSDHLIDVPPVAIRNLWIGNTNESYFFPFREHAGTRVHEQHGVVMGNVSNPIWLINDSYHWKQTFEKASLTNAGSDYSAARNEVYYFNAEGMTIFNIKSGETKSVKFASLCPIRIVLGNSFVDEGAGKLYVYETFYDPPYSGPTLASLDLNTLVWTAESNDRVGLELHHHSSFFNNRDSSFTVFGGFGAMRYSNEFYTYSLLEHSWRTAKIKGDHIVPRYFSSAGQPMGDRDIVYLFGGMGNEAGKHIIGRKYFYDLYKLDLDKGEIRKKWEAPGEPIDFVPARGIVIPDSINMYVLGYPEHLTNSFIKLYRYDLTRGEHTILGDSIPIFSDRISTRAKLYYDHAQKKLVTLVQESPDDVRSTLKVFVLDFPPISEASLNALHKQSTTRAKLLDALLAFLLCTALILLIRKAQKPRPRDILPDSLPVEAPIQATGHKPNSVQLFGDFTVINRAGKDISHLFSLRLRQVFCLLLSKTGENGVSSQLLNYTLWPDKEKEKAKTLRGVTINHLRKVLSELSGVEIVFSKGHFRLVIGDECYCDYLECMRLVDELPEMRNQNEYLSILSRGKFLLGTDDIVFDKLKEETESKVIPTLLEDLRQSAKFNRPHKTIQIANCIFQFDPINEQTLSYCIKAKIQIKQEVKAHELYYRFSTDYQNVMAEKFAISFQDLLKKQYTSSD